MSDKLLCETCAHWKPVDRLTSYAAECGAGQYPGRVTFDMTCDKHSGKPQPTTEMQSQVRGVMPWMQMWGPRP